MTKTICLVACWLLPVGGQVLDVHVRAGHIAYLEQDGVGPRIRVTSREAGSEIEFRPAAQAANFKHAAVRGFAVLERNRLGVILADEARPDATHQRVLVYDLSQPQATPVTWPAPKTVCTRLAVADADKIWCLGEGHDNNVLHLLGLRGNIGGLLRSTAGLNAGASRLGTPQLLSMPQGVIAWLPAGGRLMMFTGSSTGVEIPAPPLPAAGRSVPSFALVESGALLAMAPLLEVEEETLQTRYGLFVFIPGERSWRRWMPERDFARGATLAGADGQDLAIWQRGRSEVNFLTVQ